MGCRWDIVSELTNHLRQQAASAAALSKKLEAAHVKLESSNTKADSLDKALKMGRKEAAHTRVEIEAQEARLDTAGAKKIK